MSRFSVVIAAWFSRGHIFASSTSPTCVWVCTTQAILRAGAQDQVQCLSSLFANIYVSPRHSSPSTGGRSALAFVPFTEKKYALTLPRFCTSSTTGPSGIRGASELSLEFFFDGAALIRGVRREARSRSAGIRISVSYGVIIDKKETVLRSPIEKSGQENQNRQEGGRLYARAASPRIIS